jgi:hypothetical protein
MLSCDAFMREISTNPSSPVTQRYLASNLFILEAISQASSSNSPYPLTLLTIQLVFVRAQPLSAWGGLGRQHHWVACRASGTGLRRAATLNSCNTLLFQCLPF